MRRQVGWMAATAVLALGPIPAAHAQEQPDFSDTWVVEQALVHESKLARLRPNHRCFTGRWWHTVPARQEERLDMRSSKSPQFWTTRQISLMTYPGRTVSV